MSEFKKPWLEPGYTGKLRETPMLPCQPGFAPPKLSVDEKKELLYTGLADGDFDVDVFNTMMVLLNRNMQA